jgi:hypothetical protein
VRRAEQYIAAFPGKRLAEQSPADVHSYLSEVGRSGGLGGLAVPPGRRCYPESVSGGGRRLAGSVRRGALAGFSTFAG